MHDAVDAGNRALDIRHAGEIGRDEGLLRPEIGRQLKVAQQQALDAASSRCRVPMPPAAPVIKTICMMCSLLMKRVSGAAEPGGEPLVALAAVEQVPAHRRARGTAGRGSPARCRGAPAGRFRCRRAWVSRAAADGLPRDDEASEMLQEALELRIAGGVGDAAMERKILGDRVLAAPERDADGIQAVDDLADLRRRGAVGRQPAASISIPVRSSITSSTARSGDNWSKSIRSGRRAFSGEGADALA